MTPGVNFEPWLSSAAMPDAIFVPDGDRWVPTEAALSPWTAEGLHGSAPTMLLARELERMPADQPMFVSRLTVELLRTFGMVPLRVTSRVLRPGRKVQLLEASLWNGETEVVRATGLRIKLEDVELPPLESEPPPGPLASTEAAAQRELGRAAYHTHGVEIRMLPGVALAFGPKWAWFRLRQPVVPGEEPSPLQRVCAAADFPNGISRVVDPRQTIFINPDLTIHLHRLPEGEWVCVDARSFLEPHGTGMAEGALYDERGRLGRSLQSLLVESRGAPTAS